MVLVQSKAMNQTKVYAVIAGTDHEGEDFATLRLFDCKSSADAYAKHLKVQWGADYVLTRLQNVCMESALTCADWDTVLRRLDSAQV